MARKKKKRRVLKVKNILIFFMVVLVIVGAIYYSFKMPVKNIYITGNDILSDDIIINDSKLVNYPSFLLTSSSEIESNIKNNNYVDKVKVKKKLGNIIEIKVTEYKVLAMVGVDEQLILSSGKVVDNVYDISDVPIINNTIVDDIFNDFISKFSQVNDNILRQISQIEYSPVNVDKMRFLLYMDDGNMVYITLTKIDKLNKYNRIKDKMENHTGIIYLDSGDYVELKDNRIIDDGIGSENQKDNSNVGADIQDSSNGDIIDDN